MATFPNPLHIKTGVSGLDSQPMQDEKGFEPFAPPAMSTPSAGFDSTRLLAIFAVVGGVGIFGYATVFPDPWRMGTAIAYAVAVIVPTIWLLGRK